VAPQNIEGQIKAKSGIIGQVVVHGDKRKFLSAIVTLDEEALKAWAASKGLSGDYKELTQKAEVQAEVERVMKETEQKGKPGAEMLTPSLKVKRKAVNERYKDIFDGFYAGDGGAD
jgi:long-chain acyl-CoA synthetase